MGGENAIAANKALMRRITDEIWNRGKLDLIDELIAYNLVDHVRSKVSRASQSRFSMSV